MDAAISVLVVHYFAEELLPSLFGSMKNFLTNQPSEIIIWDNGSQSGKPSTLSTPCSLTWLQSVENVGFASGHNALARQAKGKWLLIINPDAEFAPGGLELLWKAAIENPQAGAVVPRILFPDEQLQVSVFPPYSFGFDLRKSFWVEHSTIFSSPQKEIAKKLSEAKGPFPVGWASGACLLVSREAWEKVGGFDPNFFFGGEDADLCLRVWEAGFEVLCEPRALLVHQAGQSLEREPKRKVLFYYQKRLYYANKHFSQLQYCLVWLVSAAELVVKWVVGFFFSFFSRRWEGKRRGYAGALFLLLSGRWRNAERLMQKTMGEIHKTIETAV